MTSFAHDHLRFLGVDGLWWPGLIFNSYGEAQEVSEKCNIQSLKGFINMNNDLAKVFIRRLRSKLPTKGRVAIVLDAEKKIVWEESIGETKSFYRHLATCALCPEYDTTVGWLDALTEAEILLDIPRVPTEPSNVLQVEPASNQEVAPAHEAIASAAMAPSPPRSRDEPVADPSPADTSTVIESIGEDCWGHEEAADADAAKQSAVTPAGSARAPSQETSEPDTQERQDATKSKKTHGGKEKKSGGQTKQVPRKKTKEPPKSLLRLRRSSPQKRAQSAQKKKGVKFNVLPKRLNAILPKQTNAQVLPKRTNAKVLPKRTNAKVLPKRNNAQDVISVVPDDPSVMSEEAISEEYKVPTTREVLPILLKLGYKNVASTYYRPGYESKEKKHLEEGVHYFRSASDLRRFLCRRGIHCTGFEGLSGDEKTILRKWVRLSICPALRNVTEVPIKARDPFSSIHNPLLKLGFVYRGDCYYLPGTKPNVKFYVSINGCRLDGADGMWANLCRHGLPDNSDFKNVSKTDRLRLELFLAECPCVDTFEFVEEENPRSPFFEALSEVTHKPETRDLFPDKVQPLQSIETPVAGNRANDAVAVTEMQTSDHGSATTDSVAPTIVTNGSVAASIENHVSNSATFIEDNEGTDVDEIESPADNFPITQEPRSETEPTSSSSPSQCDDKSIVDINTVPKQSLTPLPTKTLFEETPSEVVESETETTSSLSQRDEKSIADINTVPKQSLTPLPTKTLFEETPSEVVETETETTSSLSQRDEKSIADINTVPKQSLTPLPTKALFEETPSEVVESETETRPPPSQPDEKSIADTNIVPKQRLTPLPTKALFEETPFEVVEKRECFGAQNRGGDCQSPSRDETAAEKSPVPNQEVATCLDADADESARSPKQSDGKCTAVDADTIVDVKAASNVHDGSIENTTPSKNVTDFNKSTSPGQDDMDEELEHFAFPSMDENGSPFDANDLVKTFGASESSKYEPSAGMHTDFEFALNQEAHAESNDQASPESHEADEDNKDALAQEASVESQEGTSAIKGDTKDLIQEAGAESKDEARTAMASKPGERREPFTCEADEPGANMDGDSEIGLTQEVHAESTNKASPDSHEADEDNKDALAQETPVESQEGTRVVKVDTKYLTQEAGAESKDEASTSTPSSPGDRSGSSTDDVLYEQWIQKLVDVVKPDDYWLQVLGSMRRFGLKLASGGDLVVFTFPGRRARARGGILGHDYGEDVFDLKMLAVQLFNWKGDTNFHSEKAKREKAEGEKAEGETAECEKAERGKAECEKTEYEKAECEKTEREKAECEKVECEKAECEKAECEKAECEKAECEKTECEKAECEKAEREKAECEKAEREKAECEKAEFEKAECEKAECEKAEREKAECEKAECEKAECEKAECEKAEREKAEILPLTDDADESGAEMDHDSDIGLTQEAHAESNDQASPESHEADEDKKDALAQEAPVESQEGTSAVKDDKKDLIQEAGVESKDEARTGRASKPGKRKDLLIDEAEYEKWIQNLVDVVKPDDHWVEVQRKMNVYGMTHANGAGSGGYDFNFPGRKPRSKGGMLGHGYVEEVFDLKMLAVERFNWNADEKVLSEKAERESGGRRAKRSRNASPVQVRKRKAEKDNSMRPKAKQHRENASPQASRSLPTPEKKETIGEKLESCQRVLQESQKTKKLSIVNNGKPSKLKVQVDDIQKFLNTAIASNGGHGETKSTKPILYICGSPGVGKTTAVDWCCEQAVVDVNQGDLQCVDGLKFSFVNGISTSDAKAVLKEIAEGLNIKTKQMTVKLLMNYLKKNEDMLILVIDEVDNMVLARGESSPKNQSEKLLQELCELASDPSYKFALIGISNAVDSMEAKRLKMIGMDGKKISFAPYGQSDLVELVVARIGSTIVQAKALEFLAAKVAARSGDARMMLELVDSAIAGSYASLTDAQRRETVLEKPIVTIGDAMKVIKGTVVKYVDRIEALPEMAKLVLCVAVTVCCNVESSSNFTLSQLRGYCSQIAQREMNESMDFDTFKQLVQQLVDQGLLLPNNDDGDNNICSQGIGPMLDSPVRFGAQLHDVQSAIAETVESKPVYKRLIEHIKEKPPC